MSEGADNNRKFPTHKDHLNKTFLEEIGYKIWSTKGVRFKASERLLIKSDLSNKAIGFLSAYLIIFGLLSVYKISSDINVSDDLIAFGTTTLSILLLAFTQMEFAQDYKTKASSFHECALKLSSLYDEVRIFKTIKERKEDDKITFCNSMSKKYQEILSRYANHSDIDYLTFRNGHLAYFNVSKWERQKIKLLYYFQVKLLYHLLIGLPPLIFVTLPLFKNSI